MSASMKTCPCCAESISEAAKVCPRCRQWLKLLSFRNPAIVTSMYVFVVCVMGVGMIIWFERIIDPTPNFATQRDSLKVIESKRVFYERDKQPRLRTIVLLTNQSPYSWKDIEMEVRFFNNEHRLIDVGLRSTTTGFISGHDELALLIESVPCRPEVEYSSHEVAVRSARNSCAFP